MELYNELSKYVKVNESESIEVMQRRLNAYKFVHRKGCKTKYIISLDGYRRFIRKKKTIYCDHIINPMINLGIRSASRYYNIDEYTFSLDEKYKFIRMRKPCKKQIKYAPIPEKFMAPLVIREMRVTGWQEVHIPGCGTADYLTKTTVIEFKRPYTDKKHNIVEYEHGIRDLYPVEMKPKAPEELNQALCQVLSYTKALGLRKWVLFNVEGLLMGYLDGTHVTIVADCWRHNPTDPYHAYETCIKAMRNFINA